MSDKGMDIEFDLPKNRSNVIKVIGVGGGGSNAINYMFQQGINGVDFVVSNTDAQALENSPVPTKVQLGVNLTEGLGAGANPDVGEQAALESFEELKNLLDSNTKMLFITAGMGGGTGTGAAPVIAKQAKDMDILTVGIVTIPFKFEGKARNDQAQRGVDKMRKNVDSLIVINNNKLREVYGNLGYKTGFSKADEVLATAARGIAEVITHHYMQNIDLRDAKTVLSNSGTAIMGSGSATGGNRAQEAIEKALDSPLLNDNKIAGAENVLLLIVSGSQEITIDEIGEINDHIQTEAGHNANIIMGIGEDDELDESISVTIIATGFAAEQQNEIANSESKKIIHTLESEQKAVQLLTPEKSRNTAFRKEGRPITDEADYEKANKKIVHTLDDEFDSAEEAYTSSRKKEGMAFSSASQVIQELTVDYTEISFDEDDFVITDADENDHHDSAVKANGYSESESTVDEPEPLFKPTFQTQNPSTPHSPRDYPKNSNQGEHKSTGESVHVDDEIELFPGEKESTGTKRYSLEDYIEKEQELNDARPKEENDPNEPQLRKKQPEQSQNESEKPTPRNDERNEIDPLNTPIVNEMASRIAERRATMKQLNYRFRKSNNIDEIEKQPAYKRAGVNLDDTSAQGRGSLSRTSLDDGEDGKEGPHLRSNNSFLHDNVD